jgi:hypothetical protein
MELAKYLILFWQGSEQAVAFPAQLSHLNVFNYMRRESPGLQAVGAGFFADEAAGFWHGGVSESLKLTSRPQDGLLIQRMLNSRARRNWDLRVLVWEACEASRRNGPRRQSPELSISA